VVSQVSLALTTQIFSGSVSPLRLTISPLGFMPALSSGGGVKMMTVTWCGPSEL